MNQKVYASEMMRDIEEKKDIILLIDRFYDKVKEDQVIGYFFNDVAKVNWETHLPKMYEFWSKVVFSTGDYNGNPMSVHQAVHHQSTMTEDHFKHWVNLFHDTVDELFTGENAQLIKSRSATIAAIMVSKVVRFNSLGIS
ncbi:MAG TPA: group III truncated hemoglobin [Saprospiraceae bacterium]|nr:group III truncated hemoglobin [Saprospiraceae bacterium]